MIGPVDVVLVRMDKIGDLVLSLPVDQHPTFAGQRVHWFISRGLKVITTRAEPARAATAFTRAFRPWEFLRAWSWFRRHRPRAVILLHNPWWMSMAAALAGVPERIGRRSQWHSFLFVNLPIRQKRSRADRHENDFNFDLVEWSAIRLGYRATSDLGAIKTRGLRLLPVDRERTVASLGLGPGDYRVVHPGMAGSALNWPAENFAALVERFANDGAVVITGTRADQKFLKVLEPLKDHVNVHWLVDRLNFEQLFDLLHAARVVVAPSTGVLHLAASLGAPSLGIYSSRGVEHPRRWGPKGPRTKVLVAPDSDSKDVMSGISVETVYLAARELERGH